MHFTILLQTECAAFGVERALTLTVIAAVLLGALLHALWNTLAKHNAQRAGDAVLVGVMAGIPAALTLPWTDLPLPGACPQIAASAIIHVAYFKILAGAYRGGDLSVAYQCGVASVLDGIASRHCG